MLALILLHYLKIMRWNVTQHFANVVVGVKMTMTTVDNARYSIMGSFIFYSNSSCGE